MAFEKITENEYSEKGVRKLPVVPSMESGELQRVFDELCLDVLIPKFNDLISALEGITACKNIGVTIPDGLEVSTKKLQNVLDALASNLGNKVDKADGKGLSTNDYTTGEKKTVADAAKTVTMLKDITGVTNEVASRADLLVTAKAVLDYAIKLGAGDMMKMVYDKNGDGVVDNASSLGGVTAETIIEKIATISTITLDKENQIAYIVTNQA